MSATCPHCQLEMDVPHRLRGGEVECPQCEQPFATEPLPLYVTVCPNCELEMDVPPGLRGGTVLCPTCNLEFLPGQHTRRQKYIGDLDPQPSISVRRQLAMNHLRPAASSVLVVAALRLVTNGYYIATIVLDLVGGVPSRYSLGVLALVFVKECITTYAAWRMLTARSYGMGVAACLLLLFPTYYLMRWDCCMWPLSFFFAIWGLGVVNDPNVRWLIRQNQLQESQRDHNDV